MQDRPRSHSLEQRGWKASSPPPVPIQASRHDKSPVLPVPAQRCLPWVCDHAEPCLHLLPPCTCRGGCLWIGARKSRGWWAGTTGAAQTPGAQGARQGHGGHGLACWWRRVPPSLGAELRAPFSPALVASTRLPSLHLQRVAASSAGPGRLVQVQDPRGGDSPRGRACPGDVPFVAQGRGQSQGTPGLSHPRCGGGFAKNLNCKLQRSPGKNCFPTNYS